MVSIKIKGSNEDAFPITIELTQSVFELKEMIAKHYGSDTCPPDSQRLIFAGRVLKDEDKLEVYKVQDGSTYLILI
jgi:ubiquilin